MMFCGLMSRWMMSRPWATERLAYLAADLGDLALVDGAALVDGGLQIRPRTYSMTM